MPVSLISTFGVMYLLDYSLDNLSLMALTIATGFVVDDAIVVLENISRYREQGVAPLEAALRGAREITFTVLSMTLSLVAVLSAHPLHGRHDGPAIPGIRRHPVRGDSGLTGGLPHDDTYDVCQNIGILRGPRTRNVVSARRTVLRRHARRYARSLSWVLRHPRSMLTLTLVTMVLSVYLYTVVPKGFFPQQDTGRSVGNVRRRRDSSFQAMRQKLTQVVDIIKSDPR